VLPGNAFLPELGLRFGFALQLAWVRGIRPETRARASARLMRTPNAPFAPRIALLWLALAVIPSCGVQQRAAEQLIDPQLRSEGVLVERQRGARDLELGRYRVTGVEIVDERFDGSGPFGVGHEGADTNERTRPTQQLRMSFTLVGGASPWTAECVAWRRQPPDHDFAAVADELRDEVALHCQLSEISGGEARWVMTLDGDLADNLLGRLEPAAGSAEGREGSAKVVEVVMWHRLWNFTRRHLPASLALIRAGAGPGAEKRTEAALILDAPERAWLDPELDASERELALTALLALRLIPLGFEG
jgi:hypothetical protein